MKTREGAKRLEMDLDYIMEETIKAMQSVEEEIVLKGTI